MRLSPDDKYAVHLHALLLTSQKQMGQSYAEIYRISNDYPDVHLLLTKASIEEELYGCEQAILTCKEAFIVWKNQYHNYFNQQNCHQRGVSHSRFSNIKVERKINELSICSGGPNRNASINTENETETTLKVEDGIKNLFFANLKSLSNLNNQENLLTNCLFSIDSISFSLFDIFEHLIRYYIKLGKIDESERCLKELNSLNPLCSQMFYIRGLINDAKQQFKLAKQNYNDALAIHPFHLPTLIQLTKLLIQIGNYSLAEKYARDAISIQPYNYQPWFVVFNCHNNSIFVCLFVFEGIY